MKRTLASIGLFLFVAGALLVPVMHQLQHMQDGGEHHCACGGCAGPADASGGQHPNNRHHDRSSCLICQFAAMAFELPAGVFAPAVTGRVVCVMLPVPCLPDFRTPRLLPFACGPPGGFCSLNT